MKPPLGFIDLPWFAVLVAELRAEKMTQDAWIDELARKWRLVRIGHEPLL